MKNKFLIKMFFLFFFLTGVLYCAQNKENAKEKEIQAIEKLTNIIKIVEEYYVDDLNLTAVVNKAIVGLLSNLDAHSSYLDEKAYKNMQIQTSGEFGGLGITIGMKDGALTVISPIDDTPAYKAGIKAGDVILRINENSTIGMSIDEAVSQMRGKPKTEVEITIVRKGEKKPFNVKIIRDIIKVESVISKLITDDNVLYIRITNFDKHVTQKVKKAIRDHRDAKGIILDLRNNPGGLLNQAVGVVNLFVDKGVIVSQRGKDKKLDEVYEAKPKNKISDLPLAVLVNIGSASASEIVSGALQDLKRAVIVGENTFGKGSVQILMPFDKQDTKDAIRITIAKYYLPSSRTIQAVGVKPDIIVHPGKVPLDDENDFSIKEADLKKHLENELSKIENPNLDNSKTQDKNSTKENTDKNKTKNQSTTKKSTDNNKTLTITTQQVNNDIQLKTAIDAIKILNITNKEEK